MIPGTMPAIDVGNAAQTDADRAEVSRRKAVRVYFAISIIQVLCGLATFACSSFAVHFHTGGGFPYFAGSFAIAGMMLVSSMIAFRVYNKGPLFTTCELARKEVLCALNWHRGVSFFMFFICVFGLAIIWMYGLCVMKETECSYNDYVQTNKNFAIIVFALGCVGLITSAVGVALIRKFGEAFGLQVVPGRRGGLRYVGFPNDVISELRRQNAEMQRQLNSSHINYTNMPPGCQGFTNYGFEPPSPPPYSPTSMELSVSGAVQPSLNQQTISTEFPVSINPPKYSDLEHSVIPNEPPPAYKESSEDDGLSGT